MRQRIVIVADTQSPFEDAPSVALAIKHIQDYKPEIVVMNGDMVDLCTASKFHRSKRGPQTVKEEVEWALANVIEPLRKAAPKAKYYWVEGNHEFRLVRYVQAMAPVLEGLIEAVPIFQCERLGIEYVSSKAGNGILKLIPGVLAIMHGDKAGTNPAKAQYLRWRSSLVMGHVHKESTYRESGGDGPDHVAMSSGCLCQEPDWADVNNYNRGFISGWVDIEAKQFDLHHMRILAEDWSDDKATRTLITPWGSYYAKLVNKRWVGTSVKGS